MPKDPEDDRHGESQRAMSNGDHASLAEAWGLQEVFASLPLFAELSEDAIESILQESQWISLPGGATLFQEGDPGNALYLVTSGALVALVRQADGREVVVANIHAGETVGEMAVISGEPRSATVLMLRDSSLLRITKETFERLVGEHPTAMLQLTRQLVRRLFETTRGGGPASTAKTIALLPGGPTVPCRNLAQDLAAQLAERGQRICVLDSRESARTAEWFHAIEGAHDLILFVAETGAPAWSLLCIRQADRIIHLVEPGTSLDQLATDPRLDTLPRRPCDLVVLHPPDTSQPSGPSLAEMGPRFELCYNLRRGNRKDLARLARLLTGRATGLVLSSGGARGFAHLGAVRALRAAGIPFDLLGGASMGAVVAAGLALEWDDVELEDRLRDAFVQSNPLKDYTLPLVALVRGSEVTRRLRHHFGEQRIERLWRPFFCVSTNLTTAARRVHHAGPLWRALRASVAIPGLLPPVVERGEVLVDGGVIDGFPISTMRAYGRGPVMGVNVSADQALTGTPQELEEGSPWWLMSRAGRRAPGIVSLLVRAGTVSSDAQSQGSRDQVDLLLEPPVSELDLLDWRAFRRAIELGYDHTMRALDGLEKPFSEG